MADRPIFRSKELALRCSQHLDAFNAGELAVSARRCHAWSPTLNRRRVQTENSHSFDRRREKWPARVVAHAPEASMGGLATRVDAPAPPRIDARSFSCKVY
ncbi:hypothetical protein MESS4_520053 [Mesorhizobium sp. STM 4661]|nr:hypothetical protein MESS4_520053 [Mesorhizobium sp. STM 4661]